MGKCVCGGGASACLNDGCVPMQLPSICCLCAMAVVPRVRDDIMKDRLLHHLILLLRHPNVQVQDAAMLTIRRLAESDEHRNAVLFFGMTEELYRFIQYASGQSREHAGVVVKLSSFRRGVEDDDKRLQYAALPTEDGGGPATPPRSHRSRSGRGLPPVKSTSRRKPRWSLSSGVEA